jgi:hypothetical protein
MLKFKNLSRLASADLRLRQRGHWDRHQMTIAYVMLFTGNLVNESKEVNFSLFASCGRVE